jgi:hypothetical protein
MKIFNKLFFVIFVIWCDSSNTIAFEKSDESHDGSVQKTHVEQLQKKDIPHKGFSDESITHLSKDDVKIKEIKMGYSYNNFEPYTCYFDKSKEKRFLNVLEAKNIKYEIKQKSLGKCITWSKEDDERVKQIQEEMFKPTVWFNDSLSEQNFLKKLEKESIKYTILEEDGHRKIYWSEEDDVKASAIFHEPSGCMPSKESSEEKAKAHKTSLDRNAEIGTNETSANSLQDVFIPRSCYFDEKRQKRFMEALEGANIKYEIKSTKVGLGVCIAWLREEDRRVRQIEKRMLKSSAWFDDLKREKFFLERLELENIEYTMFEENGRRKISWTKEDDPKIDKIFEEIKKHI